MRVRCGHAELRGNSHAGPHQIMGLVDIARAMGAGGACRWAYRGSWRDVLTAERHGGWAGESKRTPSVVDQQAHVSLAYRKLAGGPDQTIQTD